MYLERSVLGHEVLRLLLWIFAGDCEGILYLERMFCVSRELRREGQLSIPT